MIVLSIDIVRQSQIDLRAFRETPEARAMHTRTRGCSAVRVAPRENYDAHSRLRGAAEH